jgi:hypothetical protein
MYGKSGLPLNENEEYRSIGPRNELDNVNRHDRVSATVSLYSLVSFPPRVRRFCRQITWRRPLRYFLLQHDAVMPFLCRPCHYH